MNEINAEFIVRAVNAYEENQTTIRAQDVQIVAATRELDRVNKINAALLEAAKAVQVEHDTIDSFTRLEMGEPYAVEHHDDKNCRACALNKAIAEAEKDRI